MTEMSGEQTKADTAEETLDQIRKRHQTEIDNIKTEHMKAILEKRYEADAERKLILEKHKREFKDKSSYLQDVLNEKNELETKRTEIEGQRENEKRKIRKLEDQIRRETSIEKFRDEAKENWEKNEKDLEEFKSKFKVKFDALGNTDTEEKKTLVEEKAELERRLGEALRKVDKVERAHKDTSKELEEARERLKTYEEQQNERFKAEWEKAKGLNDNHVKLLCDRHEDIVTKLKVEIEKLKEEFENERRSHRDDVAQMKKECGDFKAKLEEGKNEEMKKYADDVTNKAAGFMNEKAELEGKIKNLEETLERERSQAQNFLRSTCDESGKYKQRILDLENEMEEKKKKYEDEIERLNDELSEKDDEIKWLNRK